MYASPLTPLRLARFQSGAPRTIAHATLPRARGGARRLEPSQVLGVPGVGNRKT